MSKYRKYIQHIDGVNTLLTWSQNKCQICHRYLSKEQKKYCDRCAEKVGKEQHNTLNGKSQQKNKEKHREEKKLRDKIYYNPNRFNVGDII